MSDARATRAYLGDGLYAEFDGYQFALIANNGIQDTDVVYLDQSTLQAFNTYIAKATGGSQ